MSDKYNISISFAEELVGDEKGSDSFYLRVTPVVKINKKEGNNAQEKKAIIDGLMREVRKKGKI